MKDCFGVSYLKDRCFSVSMTQKDCFDLESNVPTEDSSGKEAGGKVYIPDVGAIKDVAKHGLNTFDFIGTLWKDEWEEYREVLASVLYEPADDGGVYEVNSVLQYVELSNLGLTLDEIERLEVYDATSDISTTALVTNDTVYYLDATQLFVIGTSSAVDDPYIDNNNYPHPDDPVMTLTGQTNSDQWSEWFNMSSGSYVCDQYTCNDIPEIIMWADSNNPIPHQVILDDTFTYYEMRKKQVGIRTGEVSEYGHPWEVGFDFSIKAPVCDPPPESSNWPACLLRYPAGSIRYQDIQTNSGIPGDIIVRGGKPDQISSVRKLVLCLREYATFTDDTCYIGSIGERIGDEDFYWEYQVTELNKYDSSQPGYCYCDGKLGLVAYRGRTIAVLDGEDDSAIKLPLNRKPTGKKIVNDYHHIGYVGTGDGGELYFCAMAKDGSASEELAGIVTATIADGRILQADGSAALIQKAIG